MAASETTDNLQTFTDAFKPPVEASEKALELRKALLEMGLTALAIC